MHIYELKGSTLTRDLQLTHLGPVTDVRHSPDDQYLVACDANRKVILYSVPEYKVSVKIIIKTRLNCKRLFLFAFIGYSR